MCHLPGLFPCALLYSRAQFAPAMTHSSRGGEDEFAYRYHFMSRPLRWCPQIARCRHRKGTKQRLWARCKSQVEGREDGGRGRGACVVTNPYDKGWVREASRASFREEARAEGSRTPASVERRLLLRDRVNWRVVARIAGLGDLAV